MTERPLGEDLLRRLHALPHYVRPTVIQLTKDDLMRLRMERDASHPWKPAQGSEPETWHGIPIELIETGGPHIHYSGGSGTPPERGL
jgi:hypothetical protein